MGDKKDIDKLFASGLQDFEATPPQDAWAGIIADVDQKKKAKRALIWRWAAVAAALILAFYSGYYFNDSQKDFPKQNYDQNNSIATEKEISNEPIEELNYKTAKSDEKSILESSKTVVKTHDEKTKTTNELSQTDDDLTNFSTSSEPLFSSSPHSQGSVEPADDRISEEQLNLPYGANPSYPFDEFSPSSNFALDLFVDNSGYTEDFPLRKPVKPLRYSVGFMASPTIPFIENRVNTTDEASSENIKKAKPKGSYAVGLTLGYRISKRLQVNSGISINHWKQSSNDLLLSVSLSSSSVATNTSYQAKGYTNSTQLNFDGFSDPSNQGQFETSEAYSLTGNYAVLPSLHEEYRFIDIPISLSYYLVDRPKWNFTVSGGINSRIVNRVNATITYADGSKETYDNIELQPYTSQLIAGVGVVYNISRRLQFTVKPTLLYGISKVNTHPQTDTYFHQILIYSGLSFRF